jgi:hypothetical protein
LHRDEIEDVARRDVELVSSAAVFDFAPPERVDDVDARGLGNYGVVELLGD